jgi:hypothetical protein
MKARGIFAIMAALIANVRHAFTARPSPTTSGRVSNGRQAFYAVSGGHRANQRRHYAKGWAK